jgi:hypothetical protein
MPEVPHMSGNAACWKKADQWRHTMNPYRRFTSMIVVSTLVMFGLMYLNTFEADHVFFSETRAYMAVVMGASMAPIMLVFMLHMLKDRRKNVAIVAVSVGAFAIALWLVRSQATVNDISYMKAMIPHHSIAVMTSTRAHLKDPRVRQLAERIASSQVKEIDEMKSYINDLESSKR